MNYVFHKLLYLSDKKSQTGKQSAGGIMKKESILKKEKKGGKKKLFSTCQSFNPENHGSDNKRIQKLEKKQHQKM